MTVRATTAHLDLLHRAADLALDESRRHQPGGRDEAVRLAEAGLFHAYARTRAAGVPHCVLALARAYLGQVPS